MIGKGSLTLAGLVLFVALCAMNSNDHDLVAGRVLYEANCARCHGLDGAKGKWGAKDLRKSRLADTLILRQVAGGRGIMPAFEKKLTAAEMRSVMTYVKGLRTVP